MFKKVISLVCAVCAAFSLAILPVYAEEYTNDFDQIIEIQENVTLPGNVSLLDTTRAVSVTYDHNSEIEGNQGKRRIHADTQAMQGTIKLSSYTRARFEREWFQGGGVYGDSGRCWSATPGGRSYATSGWDTYDFLESGMAKTYYGISET